MPRRRPGLRHVEEDRPTRPYLPDGTLDPREWEIASSAAGVIAMVVLRDEPWFVAARPVEVPRKGVELEVLVRWLSPEVWERVPASVDGYPVNVEVETEEDAHVLH